MTRRVRTRFAPSPTGFMHIGNLRTGLYAYMFAKKNGGDFILRIEDTDQERYVEGAVEKIYSTLVKAGLDYDEGPDKDKGFGPYVQSERKPLYKEYAEKLVELGGAYYCFCDKERLESLADENGVKKYDKHCLQLSREEVDAKLAEGKPYVIRQNIPQGEGESSYNDLVFGDVSVAYADMEDTILLKSDGMPTYNFANVVDDHLMGITYVIRGSEYLSSTPKYNLLYDSFGWERPVYMHLSPIMKDATRKLSKRFGDANFEDFIARGFLPQAIINYIALLGWCPKDNREKMTLAEMIEAFSTDGISISASIFDEMKMRWLNGEYLKELSDDEFYRLGKPYFDASKAKGYDFKKIALLLKTRVDILSDIPSKVDFLAEYSEFDQNIYLHQKMKVDLEVAKKSIEISISALENLTDWTNQVLFETFVAAAEANAMKKGQILWVVRIALTGQLVTPGGASEMAEILGKAETLKRLKFAFSRI
ncbi:MAG: glutamate--tRNA ligase [Clostridia bacterium]|nr:glutamate--tRNA ligase [Clostridia bacterium]